MTKPELGAQLIERAGSWDIPRAPILGDSAYGENTALRERLHDLRFEYVLSVAPQTTVFTPETNFIVAERKTERGRRPHRARPDRTPRSIAATVAEFGEEQLVDVAVRDGPDGTQTTSRFAFVRVRAGNRFGGRVPWPPNEEWLIAEWPPDSPQPTDYWISNLPEDTPPEHLARLARMRWKIELDDKQLKGELGLDHYEGRSWLGWYHHTALVTAAHGFLTLERMRPNPQRLV
jgi:SRSO17 transposase